MANGEAIIDAMRLENEALKAQIAELVSQLRKEQQGREAIEERLNLLLKRLYGPKGEKFRADQPSLFEEPAEEPCINDGETPAEVPAVEEEKPTKPKKKGHGRRSFPQGLEHRTVVHELSEARKLCPCCGVARAEIGVEESEKLDYQPAKLFVVRHIRKKYGCQKCSKIKAENVDKVDSTPSVIAIAPAAPHIIDKCSAEAGLLAWIVSNKYMDHVPLNRQEAILSRQGIHLSRKTMCGWMAACANALKQLYSLMLAEVLKSRAIHCDETHVAVQAPVEVRKCRLWVYIGDRNHPYTVYDYRPTKARAGPEEILKDYKGFLQADAANVFDGIYLPGEITEVGCWSHARRHVYNSCDSDVRHASEGLARIGKLFEIERDIAKELEKQAFSDDAADAFTVEARQRESVPRLAALQAWGDELLPKLLPKSPLAKALRYIQRHWVALTRYTDHGFLEISNNAAERGFCAIGVGRKNWLFAGSDAGGETAAVLFSFTQTCRSMGLDPWKYLKETFEKLPATPQDELHTLLPRR